MVKRLTYIGPLAPPVTGASLVTTRMLEQVEQHATTLGCDVKVVDVQRDTTSGRLSAVARRLKTSMRGLRMVGTRTESLYVSLPGGSSILGIIPIVGLARARRVRMFLHHHSFAYLTKRNRLFGLAFRLAGPNATHLVLCGGMGRALKSHYPVARTNLVLSNAAFLRPPAPTEVRQRDEQAPLRLGHFSNLDAVKGLDTVLDACRELSTRRFPFRLRLAGPAANPEADKLIKTALEEMPTVEWVGPLQQSDIAEYFSTIDLLLFPSRYRNEAQPMVVLEAASNGVPTLATNIGCLTEMPSVQALAPSQSLADAIISFDRSANQRTEILASTSQNIEREELRLDGVINSMLA